MSLLNKVGNMLTKKNITHKKDNNKYKPAGVHVLGEDYFSSNILISEDSIEPDFQDNVKQPNVIISGSSNILPFISDHKGLIDAPNNQKQQPDKKEKKEDSDIARGFILMNGEKKFRTDNCFIRIDDRVFPCRVILTPFRLFLMPDFKKKNPNEFSYMNYFPDNFFNLFIHKIEKAVRTSSDKSFDFSSDIIMKDQRVFSLIFKNNSGVNFFDQLNGLLSLKDRSHQNVAIEYRKNNPIYKKENFQDGWNLYNPEEEFARQGLSNLDYEVNRNKLFRKTKLNENYGLCPSYPKFLITVGEITDSDYKYSADFRAKNRLPALTYYDKVTGGTIWRSAQTKSGISGNRNRFDEDLLLDITKISKKKRLYIYDCRPYLSAVANKLKGAGYENVENYPGSEIFFCEIDNIHTARNALNKIYGMLKSNRFNEDKKFFEKFDSSFWPSFIYGIILASVNIVSAVRTGYSVLIHCSDGWDRCSQLTAFSQLLIDPYFRTIKGYMTLIEKDFLSFGHQFRIRNGYYTKEEQNENKSSPILLQFLDATHQLLVQYPMYFEFNMKFLLFIANNINSGLYGTFLYDCDKEREKQNAKNKTMSCWTEILNNINFYKNQFYEEKSKRIYFFTPSFAMSRIRLWEEYFFPFTQINLNISYDSYINRFQGNFYFNIFGQMKQKSRIISNVQYIIKEKENEEKIKENLIKEINKLKSAISELTIKNNVKKELFDGLSKDTKNIIKNIAKEEGGEINLNEELNMYCFKEIPKPIVIKEEEKKEENKIINPAEKEIKKEEKKDVHEHILKNEKKEENKIKNENKEVKKDESKIPKKSEKASGNINQSKIKMFFGIDPKNVNQKPSNNPNKKQLNKEENKPKNEKDNMDKKVKNEEQKKIEDKKEKKNKKENKINIIKKEENIKQEEKKDINNKDEIKKEENIVKEDELKKEENEDINKQDEIKNAENKEKQDDIQNKDKSGENMKEEKIADNENNKEIINKEEKVEEDGKKDLMNHEENAEDKPNIENNEQEKNEEKIEEKNQEENIDNKKEEENIEEKPKEELQQEGEPDKKENIEENVEEKQIEENINNKEIKKEEESEEKEKQVDEDINHNEKKEENTEEKPKEENTDEKPKEENTDEKPTEENTDEKPTEENTVQDKEAKNEEPNIIENKEEKEEKQNEDEIKSNENNEEGKSQTN